MTTRRRFLANGLSVFGLALIPSRALAAREGGGAWTVMVSSINHDPTFGWNAPYLRTLPYLPDSGWTDGDRSGYRCLYGFLEWRGRIVGRVTFTRFPIDPRSTEDYARIIDENMVEGSRFYDGSLAPAGSNELGDCPEPTEAYEPYLGPDQRPIVTFNTTRGPLEIRDYRDTVAGSATKFQLVESTSQRATVVAYHDNDPWVVVYYDSLSSRVVITSALE